MRRRDVLAAAGAVAGATFGVPAPAISRGARRLRMVTDWPEGPGMLPSARRLARTIADASHGRISIEVSPSGAVVRPFETFDAVQAGVADMFHSHIGYFEQKSPALHFFSTVPFGFTANEFFAWVQYGGGQKLWDELAGQFNIKPLVCCSTGMQMGGWFLKEITSFDEIRGLRYRMAGYGAEVLRRLGAVVVLLPGADIVPALQSGAIDACEWTGPWLDTSIGLHKVASWYYYPGWHEPGAALTLGINKQVWESFDGGDRRLIEAAAADEFTRSLAEFNTNNALALRKLTAEGAVKIGKFNDAILKTFAAVSQDVINESSSGDELSRAIYQSYSDFRALIRPWGDIAEGAYFKIRDFG